MRQGRAEQTRRTLIQAAAGEFDRHGYSGAALSRISKAAGVTLGALTFHFPTKNDLADAVGMSGASETRIALRRGTGTATAPPLAQVVELTRTLARLLACDVCVRAAARLSRDCADATLVPWQRSWLPILRDLLDRARAERPGEFDHEGLELLVLYVVSGVEAAARAGHPEAVVLEQLRRVWTLAAAGIPGVLSATQGNRPETPGDAPPHEDRHGPREQ